MSIRDNILYGLDNPEDATEEQFMEAVELSRVDDFVQNLPDGYDTQVGERGVALSGGQRQRIAIARAIIKVRNVFYYEFYYD
jgi:ABC-type multidrug transport system fused ATPase/permease subunit